MENNQAENLYSYNPSATTEHIEDGFKNFLNKVFALMVIGLFLTFATTFIVVNFTPIAFRLFLLNNMMVFIIAELAVVLFLSFRITKLSIQSATIAFFIYAILSGLVITTFVYTTSTTTFITALLSTVFYFSILAFYGYTTKKDLSKIGNLARISLFAIIILSVVNLFLGNTGLDLILTIFSLVVFSGLTMYDVKILKSLYNSLTADENHQEKDIRRLAIIGALNLYLDFINLFINILKLFSRN
ncbi:MAG: Bax inhibitor-1/YccA family protein [Lachnospirales bacterium]